MGHSRRLPSLVWSLSAGAICACSSEAAALDPGSSPPLGSEQSGIVGGHPDRGRDPAVIAIDIDGEGLCSGALVAPRAVLTARHCVSRTVEEVDCLSSAPQIVGDREPSSLTILVGDDLAHATPVAQGAQIHVPASRRLCEHDLAVVVLDRAVAGVTPLLVASRGVQEGQSIRAVGFGKRGDFVGAGKKYVRDGVGVLGVSRSEFEVGESTCNGDSGGPAINPDTDEILGVVSRGSGGCQGAQARNVYTRADVFSALISQALTAAGTGESRPPASASITCGPGHRCPNGYRCNSARICEKAK